jgi:exportin-1
MLVSTTQQGLNYLV